MHEPDLWAPVVAALGASALTGLATFGVTAWHARRAERNDLTTKRRHAYSRLLAVTGIIVHSAWSLRLTQDLRSGLGEGIDVALRVRKPLDPFELDEWMRRDFQPLYEAWSDVWTIGSSDAVVIGNRVIDRAAEVVGQSTRRGEARGSVMRWLLGEKWTDEQLQEWLALVDELGAVRHELADLARREVGLELASFISETHEPGGATVGPTSSLDA